MNIGDTVEWTHVSQSGRSVSMTLRSGTIETIGGDLATVRTPRGKRAVIALSRLRLAGQPSQLQEFVEGMRGK